MTSEQKKWLDENRSRGWEAVGAGRAYSRRGVLHLDGTFEETGRSRPRRVEAGMFEVGMRAQTAERHQNGPGAF